MQLKHTNLSFMKKQFTPYLFAIALMGIGALGAMQISSADAWSSDTAPEQESQDVKQARRDMMEKVTRVVENIDDGAVITLTTDDAAALEHLQEDHEQKFPLPDAVTRTVENLSNGIRITLTSDDAEEVQRIQMHAQEDPAERGGRGPRGGEDREGRGGPLGMAEGVTESIQLIDNGVVITLTAEDEDTIQALQEHVQNRHEKRSAKASE